MIDPLENWSLLVALVCLLSFFVVASSLLGSLLFLLLVQERERERERERDLIRRLPWGMGVNPVCGRTWGEV